MSTTIDTEDTLNVQVVQEARRILTPQGFQDISLATWASAFRRMFTVLCF